MVRPIRLLCLLSLWVAGIAALAADAPAVTPPAVEPVPGCGLLAEYFAGDKFETLVYQRIDPTIDFNWGGGSPDPSVPAEHFTARWTGKFLAKTTETYHFSLGSDDDSYLYINGVYVQNPSIPLVAGQMYDIMLNYHEATGGASVWLHFSTPTIPEQVLPTDQLYPPLRLFGKLAYQSSLDLQKSALFTVGSDCKPTPPIPGQGFAEPALSLDGTKVVYTSGQLANWKDPNIPPNLELYGGNADGAQLRRVTNDPGKDSNPSFRKDGKKITFITNRNEPHGEIYIANYDGSLLKRVTTDTYEERNPVFSADGKHIIYESFRDKQWNLFAIDLDGSNERQLTTKGAHNPAASPVANLIAFVSECDGNPEIYLYNLDDDTQVRVTNNPAVDENPVFSPDGQEIAFISDRDKKRQIYIMYASGRYPTALPIEGTFYHLAWSK